MLKPYARSYKRKKYEERLFSQLKLIKSDRRSSSSEDKPDQLLRITVDAPSLAKWDVSGAVQLWWNDKTRRLPTKDTHDTYRSTTEEVETESDKSSLTLDA